MNKRILIGGVSLVVLALGAVVVGGMGGHHESRVDWASRRGQEAYYAPDVLNQDLKDINVNLKGTEGQRYLSVGISVGYRVGPEVADPKAPFQKAESDLRDRLTMLLSNKGLADLEGLERKRVLKQEILDQVQQAVFPDKTGRIDEVYYRNFLIQ
jgi:flagellar basal body-associated protein FliL